jgi:amyloid beta precursor protein binding protein 1
MILEGVGRFTIMDDAMVSEADLGVNFFLDRSCLGRPRAECCAELLLELNPEVQGDWFPKSNSRPAVLTSVSKKLCLDAGTGPDPVDLKAILGDSATFTIILYTLPIKEDVLELVEAYGRSHKTPIVSVHSAGFYSYFHINLPGAFPIVDTHPDDNATTDLRLLAPWDDLVSFCRGITANIDDLGDDEHGHVPFVAILMYYLDVWREAHGGQHPSTYKEKLEFREMVTGGMRTKNAEGGEENFEEAKAAVLKTITMPTLPSSLGEVFEYQHANTVGPPDMFIHST